MLVRGEDVVYFVSGGGGGVGWLGGKVVVDCQVVIKIIKVE